MKDWNSIKKIKYAQYANKTKHIVFSSKLLDAEWENTQIESGDLIQFIQRIKAENGRNIQIVGGVKLASSIINTGLVDEYRLMVNPIILGRGKSLYFNFLTQFSLELLKVETMDNGVAILSYRQLLQKF